jgi:hypothetical protein
MSQIAPELRDLFAQARLVQPDEDDVRIVVRRVAFRRRHAVARRLSSAGAVILGVLAVSGLGAIGAVATGWTPLGLGGPDPVRLVTTPDPVPRALTDRVAALRAPATAVDRDAVAKSAAEGALNAGSVYVDGIRFVGLSPLGERMYLVPVLDNVSAARDPHGSGPASFPTVALVMRGRFGGIGTSNPMPLESILSPRNLQSVETPVVGPAAEALRADRSIPAALKGGVWLSRIVPDGVVRVRVTFPKGPPLDLPVHGNVVLAHSDRELGGTRNTWFDASGAEVR